MRWSFPLLLVACVNDNGLTGKNGDGPGFDTSDTFSVPVDTHDSPTPEEECNGIDDDGDGLVDEDFPDDDGNGRADCMDAHCPALSLGSEGPVDVPEECTGTTGGGGATVPDPWNVKTKWTFKAPTGCGSCVGSYSMPAVAELNDDNGDGHVDENDNPDVVLSLSGGYVVAIDGATGDEEWESSGNDYYSGVMIADVTGDGWPDVVTGTSDKRTKTLSGIDGTTEWTAADKATAMHYVIPTAADLDEDGNPEVIHDDLVINGADGSTKFSLDQPTGGTWDYRLAAVADVDNDGDQEIAFNGKLFDSDGSELWDGGVSGRYGFWPVILQADSDSDAEIGFVGDNWSLWEPDGTNIYTVNYATTAQPGPPCVGDFDGDGQSEVAWPSYDTFVMYEIDGTKDWSVKMDDSSGLAGCSGYDLNNDGALEILFADQTSFKIFDGATGDTLYTDTHSSVTIFEYPTVADIDNDGHAEILVVHNGGTGTSLTVYENDGTGWPAAGNTWAIHDFAITNIDHDGSVPAHPDAYWTKYNVYRARVAADDPSTPDLEVAITDQCIADCDYGPVSVGVQVSNHGGADVDAGSVLRLYAVDDTGPRLVATYTLPVVPTGTALDGIEFDLGPADIGKLGWEATVDEDALLNECDESNNVAYYTDYSCY